MHRLCLMLLALLAVGAVAAQVGAVSVEVQPDRVLDGDTVTIALADLPNGTVFSLRLEGAVAPRPDGTFAFTTTDLVMPFSLEQGQVQAALENTATNELVVRKGDTQVKMSGGSENGRYATERNVAIPAGTYDEIGLSGTAAPGAGTVRAALALTGVKRGPENATIAFKVRGVTQGTMTVQVLVNTEKVYGREIALGPAGTPTPTQRAGAGGLAATAAVGRARRRAGRGPPPLRGPAAVPAPATTPAVVSVGKKVTILAGGARPTPGARARPPGGEGARRSSGSRSGGRAGAGSSGPRSPTA